MKNINTAYRGRRIPRGIFPLVVDTDEDSGVRPVRLIIVAIIALSLGSTAWSAGPLVLQSDFGVKDDETNTVAAGHVCAL